MMKEPYLFAGKLPASPLLGGKSLAIQLQFLAHSLACLGGAPQGVAGNPLAGLEGVVLGCLPEVKLLMINSFMNSEAHSYLSHHQNTLC